jgi:hypothetical protein
MIKYYQMAIEKNHAFAMLYLASFYDDQNDYDNMMKYYKMAGMNGNKDVLPIIRIEYEKKSIYEGLLYFNDLLKKASNTSDHEILTQNYMALIKNAPESAIFEFIKHLNSFETKLDSASSKITELESYITELELAPEGPKYAEAKKHFESLQASE